MSELGNQLVSLAKECLNTPFVHQGRVKGVGLDCAGLLVHCLSQLGISHRDMEGYPRLPFDGQLEAAMDSQPALLRLESWRQAEPGDILVLRVTRAPQHIVLLSAYHYGQPYIIHASEIHGKVVEHRLDEFEQLKVKRVYRVRTPNGDQ